MHRLFLSSIQNKNPLAKMNSSHHLNLLRNISKIGETMTPNLYITPNLGNVGPKTMQFLNAKLAFGDVDACLDWIRQHRYQRKEVPSNIYHEVMLECAAQVRIKELFELMGDYEIYQREPVLPEIQGSIIGSLLLSNNNNKLAETMWRTMHSHFEQKLWWSYDYCRAAHSFVKAMNNCPSEKWELMRSYLKRFNPAIQTNPTMLPAYIDEYLHELAVVNGDWNGFFDWWKWLNSVNLVGPYAIQLYLFSICHFRNTHPHYPAVDTSPDVTFETEAASIPPSLSAFHFKNTFHLKLRDVEIAKRALKVFDKYCFSRTIAVRPTPLCFALAARCVEILYEEPRRVDVTMRYFSVYIRLRLSFMTPPFLTREECTQLQPLKESFVTFRHFLKLFKRYGVTIDQLKEKFQDQLTKSFIWKLFFQFREESLNNQLERRNKRQEKTEHSNNTINLADQELLYNWAMESKYQSHRDSKHSRIVNEHYSGNTSSNSLYSVESVKSSFRKQSNGIDQFLSTPADQKDNSTNKPE